jgi:hypothetical protein
MLDQLRLKDYIHIEEKNPWDIQRISSLYACELPTTSYKVELAAATAASERHQHALGVQEWCNPKSE